MFAAKKPIDWRSGIIAVVAVANFASFVVHVMIDKASAFPAGGRLLDGQFFVRSHGHEVALSPSRYWFSYVHGWVFVAIHVGLMLFGWLSQRGKSAT